MSTIKDMATGFISTRALPREDFLGTWDEFWDLVADHDYAEDMDALLSYTVDQADVIVTGADADRDFYASEAKYRYVGQVLQEAIDALVEAPTSLEDKRAHNLEHGIPAHVRVEGTYEAQCVIEARCKPMDAGDMRDTLSILWDTGSVTMLPGATKSGKTLTISY